MALMLRAPAALAEEPASVPSTHRMLTTALLIPLLELPVYSSGLKGLGMPMVQRHTCRRNVHTYKIKIDLTSSIHVQLS